MLAKVERSYSETFIVWNDDINLIGAFIPSDKGKTVACGTIKFKNGTRLSFSSQPDDCEILYERFMFIFRFIANFYGTNIIRRKERIADTVIANSALLRKEHHMFN